MFPEVLFQKPGYIEVLEKYPGLLICIMKRWLMSHRRVGKAKEEPRNDSFGTTLISSAGASLKPVHSRVIFLPLVLCHAHTPAGLKAREDLAQQLLESMILSNGL